MPWVLGYDIAYYEVRDFAASLGCTFDGRIDMWDTIFSEVQKILRFRPSMTFCLGRRAEEINQVLSFRSSRLADPTYDPATVMYPTKEQILALRRLFGRREMWYWDLNNDDPRTQEPRPAIYGDDELDNDMIEDETVRAVIELMTVKEEGGEGEDVKESSSKAGTS